MLKTFSASFMALSLFVVACGKESQTSAVATSLPLCSHELIGRTFESPIRTITFFTDHTAGYRIVPDDIAYVVHYTADQSGFIKLGDELAPGLQKGLVLLQDCKGEKLSNWNDDSEVFKLVK